jgi:hypothetical protein
LIGYAHLASPFLSDFPRLSPLQAFAPVSCLVRAEGRVEVVTSKTFLIVIQYSDSRN